MWRAAWRCGMCLRGSEEMQHAERVLNDLAAAQLRLAVHTVDERDRHLTTQIHAVDERDRHLTTPPINVPDNFTHVYFM